jgi:PKD repeat protein
VEEIQNRFRISIRLARYAIAATILMLAFASSSRAADSGWCGTQHWFDLKAISKPAEPNACPQYGACDGPVLRDQSIPGPTQSFTTIKLLFHIIHNTDGSSPSTTESMVAAQVANLNVDYAPSRINFEYEVVHNYSTAFRSLADNEMNAMKLAFAVKPDSQLNVYVSYVEQSYSFGTFPWDPDSKGIYGGIVMTTPHFSSVQSTLAHEVGHCLGLWHTHHGVSEVTECGGCYESPETNDRDFTGDLCSDTDPTPTNNGCNPPGGNDPCSGLSWGPTDIQNYMGYSGEGCWSEFSPQQMGRMNCWIQGSLLSWTTGVRFTATNIFGAVPLPTGFDGISGKNVTSWNWTFGDGGTATVEDPVHSYTVPGVYAVSLAIQSTDGPYAATKQSYIWAYADTLRIPKSSGGLGQSARVDVYVRNYLPLTELVIPFVWASPVGMGLDSASVVGLRTASMPITGFVSFDDQVYQRAAFRIAGDPLHVLPAGSGPVVSLYFRIPESPNADSNVVVIEGYDDGINVYEPKFISAAGEYFPVAQPGTIIFCTPGDISNDGRADLTDLSYLVGYLTGVLSTLPNMSAANCNGIGIVDLGDLAYLVAYLTGVGNQPQCG